MSISCFIVGAGTLPIQCAEILLDRGHEIYGFISSDASLIQWAQERSIPHTGPMDDLIAFVSQQPFDYLFSIVNEHLLPAEILELPRKCAINYHDAPLPRYAGSHATSWALMQRETSHGITWHVMSKRVDAGDILKQYPVDIADGETALTLNAKCYEAAIRAFAELIEDIACDRVSARKQNLDERTFFARYDRPPMGCVFSWNREAYDISALVRALDFGPYLNPLGLPKFLIGKDFITVHAIDVVDTISQTPPGTITGIESNSLKVSTAGREVVLRKLQTIEGQPLSIPDVIARYGLHEGYQFKDLDHEIAERLTACNRLLAKHEAFWVQRLATLQPVALPYAVPNASRVETAHYTSVTMPIPEEITTLRLGRYAAWSLSNILLAAFAAYLARIGGVDRFDIGFREARLQRGLVGLEGFFASLLPLRLDASRAQSFEEFVHNVREQVELIRQHKTCARDVVARYPVLRSGLELQRGYALPVVVEWVDGLDDYEPIPGSEFTLVIAEDRAEWRWVYDAQVLNGDSVSRMLGQFATFLKGIAADPGRHIGDLPLLTEQERHQLLEERNDTKIDYPQGMCIHQLFEAQVERTPTAVAVAFEDQRLTYRELNARANQLAQHLRGLGVGPDVRVGLCMERSLEMVIGIWGILKAGGGYVPIDPTYPQERIAFMLEDSRVPLLLTHEKIKASLPPNNVCMIDLDQDWETIGREGAENLTCQTTPQSVAYVIYTSGSTGQPKGVLVTHQNLVHSTSARFTYYREPVSGYLMLLSFAFDSSGAGIFWTLCQGGTLYLSLPGSENDLDYLAELISQHHISHWISLPSLYALLLAEAQLQKLESLKTVIVGGEACPVELVAQHQALLPNVPLFNEYGPTEGTVWSTVYECEMRQGVTTVPIGRPIPNTRVYILDCHLQPVPIGVPGELYIGGLGVAQGYLNRPDLTAERFIHNPFSDSDGTRLYRTGDLARYISDGNIEFLGRIDQQVKVRGFRVELGEIESFLRQHPTIKECTVIARDNHLVAYIIPVTRSVPNISELRAFLKRKLPDYMLPATFVTIDKLPLLPNGKVDRRALPRPDGSRPELKQSFVGPRTPAEEVIAGIWARVLGVKQIGVHDNFFELGGHSLLAMQVMSRLRDAFQIELPLRKIFEMPTVAALALEVEDELVQEIEQLSDVEVHRLAAQMDPRVNGNV